MQRKAKAGHVTGGRVFGYDHVEVLGPDGQRSHVERRINDGEAAVVRRIFEMCAGGTGLSRITKTLNAESAPSPRAQLGRPQACAASSVREVLLRPLYRDEIAESDRTLSAQVAGVNAAMQRLTAAIAKGGELGNDPPGRRVAGDSSFLTLRQCH